MSYESLIRMNLLIFYLSIRNGYLTNIMNYFRIKNKVDIEIFYIFTDNLK